MRRPHFRTKNLRVKMARNRTYGRPNALTVKTILDVKTGREIGASFTSLEELFADLSDKPVPLSDDTPNEETAKAIQDLESGKDKGTRYHSVAEAFADILGKDWR